MCLAHELDVQKSEAFAGSLLNLLNNGALSIMISIGHRTGLFDAMGNLHAGTSHEIAEAAGLNERYVREWLRALTVGRIIEYNHVNGTYQLPAEHAAFLVRKAKAENIARITQFVGVMANVEDKVVECFKTGGGVPYSEYNRFHEVMSETSAEAADSALIDVILPSIDGLVEKLEQGINVLDLGCGMGKPTILMAKTFPKSSFTGYDLSAKAIKSAQEDVKKLNLKNIKFEVKDLYDFNDTAEEKKYDFVTTIDAVHDQPRPDNLLAGIYKTLKDDGVYYMQDISASSEPQNNMDHPIGAWLYSISTMHCMTVSLAQGGMGLGTMWGREIASKMLYDAGFNQVEIKNFEKDFLNDHYIVKK